MKSRITKSALLISCVLAVSGCESLVETLALDAIPRATFESKKTVIDEAEGNQYVVTDRFIVAYANDVQKFMRMRMAGKRVLRKVSASLQVATAAIAAALAGFGGPVTVIAGFAGVSAIIPEFQGIFQAAEGAEAFRRGAELIGEAETDYITAISTQAGLIQNILTPEGANLYVRVVASIVVVEKALLQQIPTIKQLKQAEGESDENDGEDGNIPARVEALATYDKAKAMLGALETLTTALSLEISEANISVDIAKRKPAENADKDVIAQYESLKRGLERIETLPGEISNFIVDKQDEYNDTKLGEIKEEQDKYLDLATAVLAADTTTNKQLAQAALKFHLTTLKVFGEKYEKLRRETQIKKDQATILREFIKGLPALLEKLPVRDGIEKEPAT